MRKTFKYGVQSVSVLALFFIFWRSNASISSSGKNPFLNFFNPGDTLKDKKGKDTTKLPFPFKDKVKPPLDGTNNGGLFLSDPSNVKSEVKYDPESGEYEVTQKMGDLNFRNPTYMTFDEYLKYDMEKSKKDYWKQRKEGEAITEKTPFAPKLNVGGEVFDRIFGGNVVDIRPQGSAELTFGVNTSKTANPAIPVKAQKVSNFDFDQKIQLNVIGNIGDKLKLTTSYNTEASFDFENQMKLEYTGYEDEIIKKIEAGNVSLPLSGSLITGSQSLFGLKTQLQFGKLMVTSVVSQAKGQKSEIKSSGGAQTSTFEIDADKYEANRHYFLSQYFHDRYDSALKNLPIINSTVNINRIEVWVTTTSGAVIENTRNIVALMDLGEDIGHVYNPVLANPIAATLPDNSNNSLDPAVISVNRPGIRFNSSVDVALGPSGNVPGFINTIDYERVERATRLSPSDYTFHPRLGYISLKRTMDPNQVLAVAFQYTVNGKVYEVGEFSSGDIAGPPDPQTLVVKLLKSTTAKVSLPTWDLMMKNIYSMNAYDVKPENFRMDILYNNAATGVTINYIPEGPINGKILLQVLNLDSLNPQMDRLADGNFDFIDGVTINRSDGKLIFPVVEPFGSHLRSKIIAGDPAKNAKIADRYVYSSLYDTTKNAASQDFLHNRFKMKGTYQSSSSSEINLNAFNIPQGSVTVTAGGTPLVENQDYTVDYMSGRLKIINQSILESKKEIKVSLESQSLFQANNRTFMGSRFEYKLNRDVSLGGTILRLTESPLGGQKVNIGDEPIANTIWGLDGNYRTESNFITSLVDRLPLLSTKEISTINATGEFAHLIPGHSRYINTPNNKGGNSYIDDFEGSQSSIDIKSQGLWKLAGVPQGQTDLFPEASFSDDIVSGFNRAKLAWYIIDPSFFRNTTLTPDHIKSDPDQQSNHYSREIQLIEVFPKKGNITPGQSNLPTLDLAYYPDERGPYNFDTKLGSYSSGANSDGKLNNPSSRWAGLTRKIDASDFELVNVEYIQFWLMDPFNPEDGNINHKGGELYFNLGALSEDILKDGRKSFEHGLPTSNLVENVDTTSWGRVPTLQAIVDAFANDPASRVFQDVGLDGLRNDDEKTFFKEKYIDSIVTLFGTGSRADSLAQIDPSSDDYHYFMGSDFDARKTSILDRYKSYNGLDGNSPPSTSTSNGIPNQATTQPDMEDVNRDNNFATSENYFQYHVNLKPDQMEIGKNYITNILEAEPTTKNGKKKKIKWYQFKIPIRNPDKAIGAIEDFRSISFIRMFLKNFDEKIILRFGRLEFLRGEWRKYNFSLQAPGEIIPNDNFEGTSFDVAAVNLEENSSRDPVNYILPPFIAQVNLNSPVGNQLQNEQSLVLDVCNLEDGDARAAFRSIDMDVRSYKKMEMFIHGEDGPPGNTLKFGDLNVFLRIGSDQVNNYYEYEIPLTPTPWNSTSPGEVWPEENNMVINLEDFQNLKILRNSRMFQDGNNGLVSIQKIFADTLKNGHMIRILGNPNLSALRTAMVGVRNPKKSGDPLDPSLTDTDDGLPKCAEIWVNELRLTDFDEKGGYAANARVTTKLADFGSISVTGGFRTVGFGSIEQKVGQRDRDLTRTYDVSGAAELGKFIPENINMRIPMFVGYSETFKDPQFNPLEPDIKLRPFLKDQSIPEEIRDSTKNVVQDYTKRRSMNFTNVKKEKGKGSKKNHIYDIENVAVTYAYTDIFQRNINLDHFYAKTYKGGLNYNFNNSPKSIEPFKKVKAFDKPVFKIIKETNFYLMPSRIGFQGDLDRQYSENQLRNNLGGDPIPETFIKLFNFNRGYDFKYDLSKGLKFNFQARNQARIDEPFGEIDTKDDNDSIKTNLKKLGRNTLYQHNMDVDYAIPINKIPIFSWATSSAKYSATYDWTIAPQNAKQQGNTIKNSNSRSINGNFNLTQLYNKVPYLKKISQPKPKTKNKKEIKPKGPPDKLKSAASDTTKKKEKERDTRIIDNTLKFLTGFKQASFTYTENHGTILPGFLGKTNILGNNNGEPGAGFVTGYQPNNKWLEDAYKNDLISTDSLITQPFAQTESQVLNLRGSIEPIKDLKIDLTGSRNRTNNNSKILHFEKGTLDPYSPIETGSFSISYNTFLTALKRDTGETSSEVFETFLDNRYTISQRLASGNQNSSPGTDSAGFNDGYGATNQDVLIYSFLAAYSGKNANEIELETFPKIPKLNWTVKYDGFSKLDFFKKYFKNFTLNHGYRSVYSVGSYTTSLLYVEGDIVRDPNNNFIPKKQILTVSIAEQFSPLFNIDITWNNSLLTKFEMKKDRNLSLNFSNNQLTEVQGKEYIVGGGYRIKDVIIPIKFNGLKKKLKSDLNLRTNFSYRKNLTIIRKIVQDQNQITAGQDVYKIEITADYVVSEKLNIRLYFDKTINQPKISLSFNTSNTRAGVMIRFTLGQ